MSIKSIQADFKAAKVAYVDKIKAAFMAEVEVLFAKYPTANKMEWHQYTPYYNDGDECVFGVDSDRATVNGESLYGDTDFNTPETKEAAENLSMLLDSIDNDGMKQIFGDHIEVTIDRDGTITTSYYEHD